MYDLHLLRWPSVRLYACAKCVVGVEESQHFTSMNMMMSWHFYRYVDDAFACRPYFCYCFSGKKISSHVLSEDLTCSTRPRLMTHRQNLSGRYVFER